MEAIQAAIERLNAADDIDEEELERLEAEIDRLLAAAGLKGVDDNTAVDVDEDEGDEDEREGAAAAATPDVDRRASSQVRLHCGVVCKSHLGAGGALAV